MKKHKSIITDDWEHCIFPDCEMPPCHEHHCIHGTANRKLSEKYHLVVPLCYLHHANLHEHNSLRRELEILAQSKFEEHYPELDFLKIFGRNYK